MTLPEHNFSFDPRRRELIPEPRELVLRRAAMQSLANVTIIDCRDKRLTELAESIFSADMKVPSLKFSLVASYGGFVVLCLIGAGCQHTSLAFVSSFIRMLLFAWFGFMAALFSPLLLMGEGGPTSAIVVPLFLSFFAILSVPAVRYLKQPTSLSLSDAGIKAFYARWGGQDIFIPWTELESVQLVGKDAANPDDWVLVFHRRINQNNALAYAKAPNFRLRQGTLRTAEDRKAVLEAVKKHAPEATVDPDLLHVLSAVSSASYTELWLQSLAAPPKRARLAPLEPGMSLSSGRYSIEGILAAGGQGVIYRANDTQESRPVVIKEIVLPVYGDENTRKRELERFAEESQLLQKLDNKHIVKLFDFFVEDHRGYLVLEAISGKSLSSLVQETGPVAHNQVAQLAEQMTDILRYLHGLTPPLVHRDFTPDNLILTEDGTLKLIDFNVACEVNYTTTATVVGKRAYLPPEQFRGKPTPQSDIYAMGGTLFFLLTGEEPEPISSSHPMIKRADTPVEMDELVARATEPQLTQRFENIAQLSVQLEKAVSNLSKATVQQEEPVL